MEKGDSLACVWDPSPPAGLLHPAVMRVGPVLLKLIRPCAVDIPVLFFSSFFKRETEELIREEGGE